MHLQNTLRWMSSCVARSEDGIRCHSMEYFGCTASPLQKPEAMEVYQRKRRWSFGCTKYERVQSEYAHRSLYLIPHIGRLYGPRSIKHKVKHTNMITPLPSCTPTRPPPQATERRTPHCVPVCYCYLTLLSAPPTRRRVPPPVTNGCGTRISKKQRRDRCTE